jgi:hypothetical protein
MEKSSIISTKGKTIIKSKETVVRNRMNKTDFTRNRKLNFQNAVGIMLNLLKRTLQIEIDDFYEYVLDEDGDVTITKQAFSKARQNIKEDIFKELIESTISAMYDDGNYNRFDGFRLLAIDGTTLELPNYEHLREHFGHTGNQEQTVRARASTLIDIENDLIIDAQIERYKTSERSMARNHLKKLQQIGYKQDLVLYDRGYPSRELMAYHINEGIDFLMRTKDTFLGKKEVYTGEQDFLKEFEFENQTYTVRIVKFRLPSGEVEKLVTSVITQWNISELKEIYFKRWGIETKYDDLKHKIQIENFSGYTIIAILQDFYASIYLSNVSAGFKYDVQHSQKQKNAKNLTKYTYKVNENILIGKLKNRLIKAFLSDDENYTAKICQRLINEIGKNIVPVRPDRRLPRKKGSCGIKHPPNMKKSI